MKKAVLFALLLAFASSVASAETVKQAMGNASKDMGEFWGREGKRSGIHAPTASGLGSFLSSLNPVDFFKRKQDEYNARNAAPAAKK